MHALAVDFAILCLLSADHRRGDLVVAGLVLSTSERPRPSLRRRFAQLAGALASANSRKDVLQ